MAATNVESALRVPGKVFFGASIDPTSAAPYGGTELGLLQDVTATRTVVGGRSIRVWERAGSTGDEVEGAPEWVVTMGLRGWDDDAWGLVFPNTFTGANQSRTGIRDQNTRGGNLASARATTLLFAPSDASHPGVLGFSALPVHTEEIELDFGDGIEIVVIASFRLVKRLSDGQDVEVQVLEDMTVP